MSYFSLQPKYISITKSYGIIPFTIFDNKILFLMIRRKNTFGYIDIIKGKYDIDNTILFSYLINIMTSTEKNDMMKYDFKTLWQKMWLYPTNYSNELETKFNSNKVQIRDYIQKSKTLWYEPEWEFPKGRKNSKETEINCAKREFTEETGINHKTIHIIQNIIPYEEIYVGTNFKCYKLKYFLTYISDINVDISKYQKTEVSAIKWLSYDECINKIRYYYFEKKNNLEKINNLIKSLRLIKIYNICKQKNLVQKKKEKYQF